MVSIPPARELTDLEAIALLSGLAAGAAALADEPLNQQRIAPENGTGLGCIKETGDVRKRLRLVHAVQDGRQWFACRFACKTIWSLRLNFGDPSGGNG